MCCRYALFVAAVAVGSVVEAQQPLEPSPQRAAFALDGHFQWAVGPPLLGPPSLADDAAHSIKDPTVVFWNGRWHLFCTIRGKKRTHRIEHLSFRDWNETDKAERHMLNLIDGYFCAPQVFYFTPHERWCLIYQVIDKSRKPALQPAFSTTKDIADPTSWTRPALLFERSPDNVERWIDFWVICDEARAHLFFTSLDGRMWRADTKLADFPHGWSKPAVALQGDIFEASHTYRLKGHEKYLTVVEAQAGSRRYYKAYLADKLDGAWQPLAATREKPFAAPVNVRHTGKHWTDSISHGELLRAGHDERLEVDPMNLRFLFQGVSDAEQQGKAYGDRPYRLGLLEPARR
jgi:hypothetical protein